MDVAYVPGYHTNLISLRKAVAKDCHFDTQTMSVTDTNYNTIFVLRLMYDQFVAEFNAVSNVAFALQPSYRPRLTNTAPAWIWHQRLGHPGPDTLLHVDSGLTGVKLTDAPTTIECEECIRAKHHDTVSRTARQEPATRPFQRCHLDLNIFDESYDGRKYHLHVTCERTAYSLNWNLRTKIKSGGH